MFDTIIFELAGRPVLLIDLISSILGLTCVVLAGRNSKYNFWVGYLYTAALFVLVYGAVLGVAWLVARWQGNVVWSRMAFDTAVTTANIVALVLMAKAYMDQWYLWTLVNITSIILWIIVLGSGEGSEYTVVQLIKYSFYLLNGLNAIRIWLKLSAEA